MRLTPIRTNMNLKTKRKKPHKKPMSTMRMIKIIMSDIRKRIKEVSWMHTYRKPK